MTRRSSPRTNAPEPWGHSWVPALLFFGVLAATVAAMVVGMMTESGWLWGHPGRGVALFIGVVAIELGLVWWWARACGHSPVWLLVGGVLVSVWLGLGRNWFLLACLGVALVTWIRRSARRSGRTKSW